jgi:hypothetical protein
MQQWVIPISSLLVSTKLTLCSWLPRLCHPGVYRAWAKRKGMGRLVWRMEFPAR